MEFNWSGMSEIERELVSLQLAKMCNSFCEQAAMLREEVAVLKVQIEGLQNNLVQAREDIGEHDVFTSELEAELEQVISERTMLIKLLFSRSLEHADRKIELPAI